MKHKKNSVHKTITLTILDTLIVLCLVYYALPLVGAETIIEQALTVSILFIFASVMGGYIIRCIFPTKSQRYSKLTYQVRGGRVD